MLEMFHNQRAQLIKRQNSYFRDLQNNLAESLIIIKNKLTTSTILISSSFEFLLSSHCKYAKKNLKNPKPFSKK